MTRTNPFADLDDEFRPAAPTEHKPVPTDAIQEIADKGGFPSRTPVHQQQAVSGPRRHTTGRSRQLNIKATDETIALLRRLADEQQVPLAVVFERALKSYADSQASE